MMNIYKIVKCPIITEKSTLAKDEANQFFFEVDRKANKIEIASAVEKLFKVKVTNVCTMNMHGKKKRVGKILGKKSDWKKAVITLAPGNSIKVYEGI